MTNRSTQLTARVLVLALLYFVTGRLGLLLPAFGSHITLIWLPTGIAVAALLRGGFGCWPGVAMGAVAVNVTSGLSWPVALGISVGNTAGPLLAAWLLQRHDFHPALDRPRDILLLSVAGTVGMLVSASVGVEMLALAGALPVERFAAWLVWWAGDTMGVIAAAPLVLAFTRQEWRVIAARRGEFLIWSCAIGLIGFAVFFLNAGHGGQAWAVAFLPLPMVAWAALRFGAIGTSVAIIVLSITAAFATATGRGPFFQANPIESVLVLWLFMATSAVLGWLIAALHTARLKATGIQHLFEQALSDVSLGVLLGDLDRKITYANAGFTRLTGYTEAELLGQSCRILQGPETDPALVEKLRVALRSEGFFDGEILNYRKDGTTFWNALLISPVQNERGEKTGFLAIQRNITKRRETELALQHSEEHLRTIVELEPECVKLLSPDARLLELNPAGLAMVEASSFEQVRGCAIAELIVPEDRAIFAAMHERVLRGETGRCEFSLTGLKGTRRWVETHAVPYRNAQREIVGVLGITRDITQRRQAEEALRRSEEHFRTLADHLPDVVARFDGNRRHLYINPAAEAATGLKPEAFVGRTNEELGMPAENVAVWKASLERLYATGRDERFEFSYPGPAGTAFWESHVVAERGAGGEVESVLVISRDITARKRLEQEREQYFKFFLLSTDPMCIADPFGCFKQVNPAFTRLTGYAESELVTKPYADFILPEDRQKTAEEMRLQVAVRPSLNFENRYVCKDGTVRLLSWTAYFDKNDGVTYATARDITELRQEQIEREALDRKMQETQKLESLGVLAGGIAHDFNNLLTGILGNASLASMDLPPGSPLHDYLGPINEAALRAADLCRQMLAYSGRGRFVVQRLDLGQLVEGTAQMLQISISKKAVLRFHLEKGLPPVEVDATQLRQVIMNLVINASEAIGDQSGVIALTTGLTRVDRAYLGGTLMAPELPEGEYVFLEVSDNGCGMSAETKAHIFDPFFTTKFTGRGLGLAAVLGIVRGHKGAMKVYSEPGRGTTFKLLFPAGSGSGETAAERPPALARWQGHGTVLVADDEETIRSTVARMLRLMGFEPVLVSDGREAVEVFRADPDRFALVLLDLTMPHMDGEEAFTELRRLRADVRVVLMSGFNQQEALIRFPGKGLSSFLQKPFTMDELRAVLQTVLA